MGARLARLLPLALLVFAACSSIPAPARIALLAPFEGRYREVGYEALYAARLALGEQDSTRIELLPVDDGGTPQSAADRARALTADPQVMAVIALGHAAAESETLTTLENLPVLVVGDWGAQPVSDGVFILTNPEIPALLTVPLEMGITEAAQLDGPLVGGDSLALPQLPELRPSLNGMSILSSAALPDSTFVERYRSSDSFAPEPGLLAPLAYDAVHIAVEAVQTGGTRSAVRQALQNTHYSGLNGTIRFEDGYWADAPLYTYRYDDEGRLRPADDVIE